MNSRPECPSGAGLPVDRLIAEAQARARPLRQAGDWAGVARIFEGLARIAPNAGEAWFMLSEAYAEMGLYKKACDAAEEGYRHLPPTPEELVYAARLAMFAQQLDRGDSLIARAEATAPDHPAVLAARALHLTYIGRKEDAEACCVKSIRANPLLLGAWPQLSMLRNGRLTSEEEEALRRALAEPGAPAQLQISGRFVLAHSLDARGEIDAAFTEYTRANEAARADYAAQGIVFKRAASDEWTSRITNVYRGARNLPVVDENAARPIFIVGAPRSGSTLVESVLAAHSAVAAGGEAEMLPRIFSLWLKEIDGRLYAGLGLEHRRRFANAYYDGVEASGDASCITDKNLLNIDAVGFIAEIFPHAKIIHVRRAPMEAGLGIYRQNFKKFWPWTTRLDDIGVRIGQIARIARHWERFYPERFITIQYETFTDDFENSVRRLLEFCGLDFEPQCLEFQGAERGVMTMSSVQVREPVKRRSGKAARYGAYLGPLRAALENVGVDLETGAVKD